MQLAAQGLRLLRIHPGKPQQERPSVPAHREAIGGRQYFRGACAVSEQGVARVEAPRRIDASQAHQVREQHAEGNSIPTAPANLAQHPFLADAPRIQSRQAVHPVLPLTFVAGRPGVPHVGERQHLRHAAGNGEGPRHPAKASRLRAFHHQRQAKAPGRLGGQVELTHRARRVRGESRDVLAEGVERHAGECVRGQSQQVRQRGVARIGLAPRCHQQGGDVQGLHGVAQERQGGRLGERGLTLRLRGGLFRPGPLLQVLRDAARELSQRGQVLGAQDERARVDDAQRAQHLPRGRQQRRARVAAHDAIAHQRIVAEEGVAPGIRYDERLTPLHHVVAERPVARRAPVLRQGGRQPNVGLEPLALTQHQRQQGHGDAERLGHLRDELLELPFGRPVVDQPHGGDARQPLPLLLPGGLRGGRLRRQLSGEDAPQRVPHQLRRGPAAEQRMDAQGLLELPGPDAQLIEGRHHHHLRAGGVLLLSQPGEQREAVQPGQRQVGDEQ